MTKRGMSPGVAHNPDPTFSQAEANITAKARSRAKYFASLFFRIAELTRFRIKDITLADEAGNVFYVKNERR